MQKLVAFYGIGPTDKTKVDRDFEMFIKRAHPCSRMIDTLQTLHDEVFGASGKKHSLMDRLIAAKT